MTTKNKREAEKPLFLLVRIFITYLIKSTGTNAHIQPYRRDISVSIIKKRGIIMKKVKIKLDDMERRILVKLLYEKRNELIREGGYAGSIDELILKLVDAK